MRRRFAGLLSIFMLLVFSSAYALTYTIDPDTGLYVDASGHVIEEYWDETAGIYIVDGIAYPIENSDEGTDSGDSNGVDGTIQNPDGSITVPSADQSGADDSADAADAAEAAEDSGSTEGSGGLTQEEWEARMEKAMKENGVGTGTVYTDESGAVYPVEVAYMGLGRSEIILNGEHCLVPTSTLTWETEAPENKVLAVVTPSRQSYITMRAKMSKKAFVMAHCEKCRVLRVISTGKTWTKVDENGMRGYVLTSGLTFYDNSPRDYITGVITFRGKTESRNTVHIRSSNKNSSRQLAEFNCGTALTVFEHDEKWCEVDVGGWHCYILSEFVTLEEGAVSASGQTAEP